MLSRKVVWKTARPSLFESKQHYNAFGPDSRKSYGESDLHRCGQGLNPPISAVADEQR